jgi:hypothetical protein
MVPCDSNHGKEARQDVDVGVVRIIRRAAAEIGFEAFNLNGLHVTEIYLEAIFGGGTRDDIVRQVGGVLRSKGHVRALGVFELPCPIVLEHVPVRVYAGKRIPFPGDEMRLCGIALRNVENVLTIIEHVTQIFESIGKRRIVSRLRGFRLLRCE